MTSENDQVSDHDLLIEAITVLEMLKEGFENHLAHHNKRENIMLGVTLTSIVTMLVTMLTLLFKSVV